MMARGQKKKKELTPEERLQNALVPEEEQPYELPEGWKWVRGSGFLNPMVTKRPEGETFDYIDINSIDNEAQVIREPKRMLVKDAPSRASRKLMTGDTVFSMVRPYLKNIAFIDERYSSCIASTGFYVCRPDKNFVLPRFLYWLMVSPYVVDGLNNFMKGDNSPSIRKDDIEKFPFPIPPIDHQKEIVDFIEKEIFRLDEAKDRIQSVLDSSGERKQSILHKAFTGELTEKWRIDNSKLYQDSSYYTEVERAVSGIKKKRIKKVFNPFENKLKELIPAEWCLRDLDSISRQITDGEHVTPRRVDEYCGYYLLSARNVRDDYLQLDNVDYIDEDEYQRISSRCNPKKGDVLISCSGSVGRVCVINDDNQYCMVRSAAMVSTVQCNSRFVMYMLQSPEVQNEIKELSKQTAQANLFLGAIATLLIPFPIIEEQNEIVQILDSYSTKEHDMLKIMERVNDQIEEEKQSILSKAFRGELNL